MHWKSFNHDECSGLRKFIENKNIRMGNRKIVRNPHVHGLSNSNPNQRRKHRISAILLAEDGFVYTGDEDKTKCVFCSCTKSNWGEFDDIHEVHASMSPECPMITRRGCNNKPLHPMSGPKNNQIECQETRDGFPSHNIPGTYQPNEGTKLNVMIDNYSNDDSLRLININSTNGHQNKQTPVDPNTSRLTGKAKRAEYESEHKRLETFSSWPKDHHLTPHSLSRAGLFYAGYDDCVRCYYCGGGLKNWKVEDNVWVEHARWFPKCTYIMRTVGPDFIKVVTELNKNHDQIDLTMVLAKLDADYLTRYPDITESPDKVQNDELLKSSFEKERILHNGREKLHKEPEVYTEQIKKTSGNNNILEGKQGIKTKIKIGVSLEDYEQFGVISDIPKKKEFKDPYQRLNAFKGWPSNHHLKPNILSEAGFYYTGQGDCTRCFWCGGGLRNWKDTDDVWVEHARWFPKCAYIRQKVGQIFIDAVQDYNRTHENITIEMVLNKIGRENMTCYQECLGGVKSANDELRDQTECKICLDKSVEIVFLPCGHLVSCTECAAALTLCPICRQEIQGRARAILS